MEYASNKNSHRNLGKFTAKRIFKYANDLKEDFGNKKKKEQKNLLPIIGEFSKIFTRAGS